MILLKQMKGLDMYCNVDFKDSESIIEFAKKEAENFNVPNCFYGGRFQTNHDYIFIHVNHKGELGKVEIKKPGGTKYFLNPN